MASQPMLEGEESPATLLIRHLPDAIPQDTLSRLFCSYGASSVRPCTSGRLRNCAFVNFKSEMLRFLGKVLLVERANKQTEDNRQKSEALHGKDLATPTSLTNDFTRARDLSEGLNSSSLPYIEPIAAKLGVDYPFPPHLERLMTKTILLGLEKKQNLVRSVSNEKLLYALQLIKMCLMRLLE